MRPSRRALLPLLVLLSASAVPSASAGLLSIADFNWEITPDTTQSQRTLRPYVSSRIDPVPGATWYQFERVTDATGQTVVDNEGDGFPKWYERTQVVLNYFPWWPTAPDVRYVRISAWTERPKDGGVLLSELDAAAVRTIYYDSRFDRMNHHIDVLCGTELGLGVPAWECEAVAEARADDPSPGCDSGDGNRCWDGTLLQTIAQQTELYTWQFADLTHADGGTPSDCSDDTFTFGTAANIRSPYRNSTTNRFRFSIPRDGVTFIGLYGAWNGSYGYTQRPTLSTGHRTSSSPKVGSAWFPVAVVTGDAGPLAHAVACMGQMSPLVPGQTLVKTLPSIPGGLRMTPLKHQVTIFNGGHLYLAMDGSDPDWIEVELPQTIHLLDNAFRVAPNDHQEYTVTEISNPPGGTREPGYRRYRLDKSGSGWSYLNTHLPLYFVFEPGQTPTIVGGGPYDMYVRPVLSATACPGTDPQECWRSVEITPVVPPAVPLPTRLHTSNTWSTTRTWVTLPAGHPLYDPQVNFFELYKKLGFNAVPLIGANKYDPDYEMFTDPDDGWAKILFTPAERTGPEWNGLTYAIQHSPLSRGFYDSGAPNPPSNPPWWIPGLSELLEWKEGSQCAGYPGSTLLERFRGCVADNIADHLDPPDRTQEEIDKWARALVFHEQTKYFDMAYDGALLDRDLGLLQKVLNYTAPEYVHLDAEFFPWYASQWLPNVSASLNAELRRLPAENDGQLARRMVTGFWDKVMNAIQAASPSTKVSLYDATATHDWGYQAFPWSVLEAHDVIPTSSVYTLGSTPEFLVERMRSERDALPATYAGTSERYELQPWMSTGTPNERSSEEGFDTVVQMLANGATGFNFFSQSWDIDDMDDWLKISEGIGMFSWPQGDYVTALNDTDYPQGINGEDLVLDGGLRYDAVSSVGADPVTGRPTAVIGALELDELYLVAVTPDRLSSDPSPPIVFDLALAGSPAASYVLDDLRDGDPAWGVTVTNGAASFSHPGLSRSTVLRFHRFNSAPGVQGLSVLPTVPSTGDDLTASYTFVDAEGDLEELGLRRIRWYRDGLHLPLLDDMPSVPSSETALGEQWHFELEISDGRAIGGPFVSPAVTIGCTPPPDLTEIITAEQRVAGEVTLYVTDPGVFPGLYDLHRSTTPSGGFVRILDGVGDMDPLVEGLQIIDSAAGGESYYYRVTPHFAGCP